MDLNFQYGASAKGEKDITEVREHLLQRGEVAD